MLDLDAIPEMFVSAFDRAPTLGMGRSYKFEFRDTPHADAERWLSASLEERTALAPVFAERLKARVRRLGQEVIDRRLRVNAANRLWRKQNPDKYRVIAKRYRSKFADKHRVYVAGWRGRNREKLRVQAKAKRARLKALRGPKVKVVKTHCPAGHLYDAANTRIESNNARKCRTCCAAREKARRRVRVRGK